MQLSTGSLLLVLSGGMAAIRLAAAQPGRFGGGLMGGGGGMVAPGGGGGAASSNAASLLGTVARTTVSGTTDEGLTLQAGEDIYGPFEAGFSSQQDFILEGLGCATGSDGHVAGGIDTHTAEQMVAAQCGITLPRWDGGNYISLIDTCGGHTRDYHFHERMNCLYEQAGAHSPQIGQADSTGQYLYGKWEDADSRLQPKLDACGGHFGVTPDSNGEEVYHYHVQDAAPFTFGCFGPSPSRGDGLVTVEECRSFYDGCDGDLVEVATPTGTKMYDLWCPCYDANGSNTGIEIAELAVFSGSAGGQTAGGGEADQGVPATEAPATEAPATEAPAVTAETCSCRTELPADTMALAIHASYAGCGVYADTSTPYCYVDEPCAGSVPSGYYAAAGLHYVFNCVVAADPAGPTEVTEARSTTALAITTPGELCSDSDTWHKRNKPNQGCSWVGKNAKKILKRCKKKGQDGVRASEACPMTCGGCSRKRRSVLIRGKQVHL